MKLSLNNDTKINHVYKNKRKATKESMNLQKTNYIVDGNNINSNSNNLSLNNIKIIKEKSSLNKFFSKDQVEKKVRKKADLSMTKILGKSLKENSIESSMMKKYKEKIEKEEVYLNFEKKNKLNRNKYFLIPFEKEFQIKNPNKLKYNKKEILMIEKVDVFTYQNNNNILINYKKEKPLLGLKKKTNKKKSFFEDKDYYKSKYDYFMKLSNLPLSNYTSNNFNSNYCEDNIKSLNFNFGKLETNFTKKEKENKNFQKIPNSEEYSEDEDIKKVLQKTDSEKSSQFFENENENFFTNQKVLNPKQVDNQIKAHEIKSIDNNKRPENSEHPFDESCSSGSDYYENQSYSSISENQKSSQNTTNINHPVYSDIMFYNSTYLKKKYPNLYEQKRIEDQNEENERENEEFEGREDFEVEDEDDSGGYEGEDGEEDEEDFGEERAFAVSEKVFLGRKKELEALFFHSLKDVKKIRDYNYYQEKREEEEGEDEDEEEDHQFIEIDDDESQSDSNSINY